MGEEREERREGPVTTAVKKATPCETQSLCRCMTDCKLHCTALHCVVCCFRMVTGRRLAAAPFDRWTLWCCPRDRSVLLVMTVYTHLRLCVM